VFGDDGIASAGSAQKTLVDMSTMDANHARSLAARLLEDCGMPWLDAPISGGPPAAYAGRIKYDRPKYEKAIFESFELGSSYSMPTIQAKIVKALNASWSEDLRIRKGSYIQLLNRYFGTKYSRAKKEHKLVEKIDLIRAEQIAEI
jgi:hypothetical protein